MSATILPIPARPRAIVFVEQCFDDRGCWAIRHQRPCQAAYHVATRFEFYRAEAAAREVTAQFRAMILGNPDLERTPRGAA